MASDAGEFVEGGAALFNRSGDGGGRGACFEGHEISGQIGGLLAAFFVVGNETGHVGVGSDGGGVGDPAGEPRLVETIAGQGENGRDVTEFGHGVCSETVTGEMALAAQVAREKLAALIDESVFGEGGVDFAKGAGRDGLAGEGAFLPRKLKAGDAFGR